MTWFVILSALNLTRTQKVKEIIRYRSQKFKIKYNLTRFLYYYFIYVFRCGSDRIGRLVCWSDGRLVGWSVVCPFLEVVKILSIWVHYWLFNVYIYKFKCDYIALLCMVLIHVVGCRFVRLRGRNTGIRGGMEYMGSIYISMGCSCSNRYRGVD